MNNYEYISLQGVKEQQEQNQQQNKQIQHLIRTKDDKKCKTISNHNHK